MAAEEFFARWAKKKPTTEAPADASATKALPAESELPAGKQRVAQTPQSSQNRLQEREGVPQLPTMEDVARLTHDSDYSLFMAKGVDEAVKRSAMKKLFSDPHFNVMDGLDVYIEDFTKFEPISPAMLASLEHAKELLNPSSNVQASLMRLIDPSEQPEQPASEAAGTGAETIQDKQEQASQDEPQTISDEDAKLPDKNEATDVADMTAHAAAHKADD